MRGRQSLLRDQVLDQVEDTCHKLEHGLLLLLLRAVGCKFNGEQVIHVEAVVLASDHQILKLVEGAQIFINLAEFPLHLIQ